MKRKRRGRERGMVRRKKSKGLRKRGKEGSNDKGGKTRCRVTRRKEITNDEENETGGERMDGERGGTKGINSSICFISARIMERVQQGR